MLTLKSLREDPQAVIDRLRVKNFDAKPIVDKVLELDARRRALQMESDALLAEQKKKAAEIGGLMKQGLKDAAEAAKAAVAALKQKSTDLLAQGEQVASELESQLVLLPNTPCALVPAGKDAADNLVVKEGGPDVKLPEGALPPRSTTSSTSTSASRLPEPVSPFTKVKAPACRGLSSISSSMRTPRRDTWRPSLPWW